MTNDASPDAANSASESLQQKRVFSQESVQPPSDTAEVIKPQRTFTDAATDTFTESEPPAPPLIEKEAAEVSIEWLEQSNSTLGKPWLLWVFIGFLALSSVQFGLWVWEAFQESPLLSFAWLVVVAGFVLFGVQVAFNEWRSLRALKQQAQCQRDGERLLHSVQQGEAQQFCLALSTHLPQQPTITSAVVAWRDAVQPHHQDKEIVALFDHMVLSECDKYAEQVIRQHATQTALLVALSPLALMDVFIVFVRSIRLTQQVSRCYGVSHGYWSRIRLMRQTVHQMLYVATSELLIDVAGSVIGFELLGKISSRAVQGAGAGLMAGRLGFNAQQLVRPLSRPNLVENGTRKLGKQLVETLLQQVKTKSNGE